MSTDHGRRFGLGLLRFFLPMTWHRECPMRISTLVFWCLGSTRDCGKEPAKRSACPVGANGEPATWRRLLVVSWVTLVMLLVVALAGTKAEPYPPAPEAAQPEDEGGGSVGTIFAGSLDERWTAYAPTYHGTVDMIEERDGVLVATVPAGNNSGHAGILSPEPALWLDDFGAGAEVTLTFTFDPGRTNGLVIAVEAVRPEGAARWNAPAVPNAAVIWRSALGERSATTEFHVNPHRDGDYWSSSELAHAPTTVTITLRPGEIVASADGVHSEPRPWSVLAEGQGLHLRIYSVAPATNEPATMALRSIAVERRSGSEAANAAIEPLPVDTLFDGEPGDDWMPIGVAGGDFERFARFVDGHLVVDGPEGNWWNKTGLLSTRPVVTLDARVLVAPTRLTVHVDPSRTTGLVVALSSSPVPDMWHNHVAWVSLVLDPETNQAVLGSRSDPYNAWSRSVPAEWLTGAWDGRLHVDIGHDHIRASVDGGPTIRMPSLRYDGERLHATVISHAPHEGAAARLALRRIERTIVPPPGASHLERWRLMDDEDFDPAEFLRDLANEIGE